MSSFLFACGILFLEMYDFLQQTVPTDDMESLLLTFLVGGGLGSAFYSRLAIITELLV